MAKEVHINSWKFSGKEATGEEKDFIEKMRGNQGPPDFSKDNKPTIRVEVINHLIRGIPFDDETEKPKPVKVHLENAVINGKIDLSFLHCNCDEFAPPLILNNCEIAEEIDLSRAKIKYLNLAGCKITYLNGEGLQIDGSINMDGLNADPSLLQVVEQGNVKSRTGVNLKRSAVNGSIIGVKCKLVSTKDYCLILGFSIIRGSIDVSYSKLHGGLQISNAIIENDIWGIGSYFEAKKDSHDAIDCQALTLNGFLYLSSKEHGKIERTIIAGSIRLIHAKIDKAIYLKGTIIKKNSRCKYNYSIYMNFATIGSDIHMSPAFEEDNSINGVSFEAEGTLEMVEVNIGGSLDMRGAIITPIKGEHVINAPNLHVEKNLYLSGDTKDTKLKFKSFGKINLNNATINGNLEVKDAELNAHLMYEGFYANDITVKGNIDFRPDIYYPAEFDRAKVGGRFILGDDDEKSICCYMGSQQEPKISLRGANIGQALRVRKFQVERTPNKYYTSTDQSSLLNANYSFIKGRLRGIRRHYLNGILPGWQLTHFIFNNYKGYCTSISCLQKQNKKSLIILDGTSHSINNLIRQGSFQIRDCSDAKKYIKFYCAYMWGRNNPFYIIDPCQTLSYLEQIDRIHPSIIHIKMKCSVIDNNKAYEILATGLFGEHLYEFTFHVKSNGYVTMIKDTDKGRTKIKIDNHRYNMAVFSDQEKPYVDKSKICNCQTAELIKPFCSFYDSGCAFMNTRLPLVGKCCNTPETCNLIAVVSQRIKDEKDIKGPTGKPSRPDFADHKKRILEFNLINRVDIDLTRAHVGALNDQSGNGWGDMVRLFLDGFTYKHLTRPEMASADLMYNRMKPLPWCRIIYLRILWQSISWVPNLDISGRSIAVVLAASAITIYCNGVGIISGLLILFYLKLHPFFERRFYNRFFIQEKVIPPKKVQGRVTTWLIELFNKNLGKPPIKIPLKKRLRLLAKELAKWSKNKIINKSKATASQPQKKQSYIDDNINWFFSKPWKWRTQWLMMQYRYFTPNGLEFVLHPYRQLERVYTAQGQNEDARRIALLRLKFERKRKPICFRLLLWPYEKLFGSGLAPGRAFLALIAYWIIGSIWFADLSKNDYMIVDNVPVSNIEMVTEKKDKAELPTNYTTKGVKKELGVLSYDQTNKNKIVPLAHSSATPCGDTINPWIYSLDVMIPLIDFRQEFRCQIKPAEKIPGEGLEYAENLLEQVRKKDSSIQLLFLKALYTIFGWLTTALTILTMTGVLRKHADMRSITDDQ